MGDMTPVKHFMHLKSALIIGFVVGFVSLVVSSFYFLYHAPVFGIRTSWDDQTQVWRVDSAEPPAPFRPGDALVSIEGRRLNFHDGLTDNIHIQSREELFAWLNAKKEIYALMAAPRVTVGLLHHGELIEAQAAVHQARFSFLRKIEALHLIVGTVFFLIGLIVFWKKGFEEVSVVFFLLCMAMTLTFVTNATSMMGDMVYQPSYFALMNILNIPNPMAIGAFMLHFCLLMPQKRAFLIRFRRLPWLFYTFCALAELTLSIEIINLVFPVLFIGALAALGQGYWQYKNPILRRQLLWVILGFGFGLLPFILINGIPLIVRGERFVNDTIPGLFLVFIPLFMAFAIQKYNLMAIDSLFDNTLIYTATFGALTIIDVFVVGLFSRLFPNRETFQGLAVNILVLWFVIIAYVPVRNQFRTWIKRLLKRDPYDLNDVSMRLSASLIVAADTTSIFRKSMNIIDESLHPRGGCAFALRGVEMTPVAPDACADLPSEWPQAVGRLNAAEYLYRLFPAGEIPPDYAMGVLVPIADSTGLTGCIILKNKISEKTYSRGDLNLLNLVAGQMSLAMKSIMAKEVALMREKESHEMKENISREMHDGIGGSFSNAIMMLDLMSDEFGGRAAESKRMGAMRDTLSDGLAETRTLIRTMEEQDAAFIDLKDSIEGKAHRMLRGKNMACTVEVDIENHDLTLSSLVVHHMTKIVQEAITNALKHSQARQIGISIRENGGVLSLMISDNGKGLGADLPAEDRYGLRNMRKRCDEIGAALRFHSEPGKGFEIAVTLNVDLSMTNDI
jgi:signal transduction histidine kinase